MERPERGCGPDKWSPAPVLSHHQSMEGMCWVAQATLTNLRAWKCLVRHRDTWDTLIWVHTHLSSSIVCSGFIWAPHLLSHCSHRGDSLTYFPVWCRGRKLPLTGLRVCRAGPGEIGYWSSDDASSPHETTQRWPGQIRWTRNINDFIRDKRLKTWSGGFKIVREWLMWFVYSPWTTGLLFLILWSSNSISFTASIKWLIGGYLITSLPPVKHAPSWEQSSVVTLTMSGSVCDCQGVTGGGCGEVGNRGWECRGRPGGTTSVLWGTGGVITS